MSATTRIRPVGNSAGLHLPREVLQEAGFTLGTVVSVRAEPGKIELQLYDDRRQVYDEAFAWFVGRYGRALTELAR